MQRFLTMILTIAVIAAGVSFAAAPGMAFFALRSAADSEDVQGLAQLVDYDAVRASLKAQVAGSASIAPPSFWQDPIGAITNAVTPLAPEPRVEALLKPAALAALTRGEGWSALKAKKADPSVKSADPWPSVQFWGVNRTRLAIASAQEGWSETVFTFERKGVFTWRLAHIGMPAKVPANAPATGSAAAAPAK